jgi:hypothetical protein
MQTALFKAVCEEKTSARDVAQCTRAWIDLEKLKREIRGIPPLAPAKMRELLDLKRAKPLAIADAIPADELVELDASAD